MIQVIGALGFALQTVWHINQHDTDLALICVGIAVLFVRT